MHQKGDKPTRTKTQNTMATSKVNIAKFENLLIELCLENDAEAPMYRELYADAKALRASILSSGIIEKAISEDNLAIIFDNMSDNSSVNYLVLKSIENAEILAGKYKLESKFDYEFVARQMATLLETEVVEVVEAVEAAAETETAPEFVEGFAACKEFFENNSDKKMYVEVDMPYKLRKRNAPSWYIPLVNGIYKGVVEYYMLNVIARDYIRKIKIVE